MYNYYVKHLFRLLLSLTVANAVQAQTGAISLEECHQLAKANYPAIQKLDLIDKTSRYDIENANKRFLPQLSFSGQATYQSQTINFADVAGAIPGMSFPSISKDQYKVQGEVNQLLFDGGNIKNQKALIKANAALQEQSIETNIYAIQQRVNAIYFSVLLMDAQLKQNALNKSNLQTQIEKAEAALKNGVAFRSSLEELKAEIINIEMAATEYRSNRNGFLQMLSLFIGANLTDGVQLLVPEAGYAYHEMNRPELKGYDLQKSVYDLQEQQLKSEYLPQVNAFFQGAYGRPTLNIIENKFGPWYLTGLRFTWSLGSLYTMSNRKRSLQLSRETIEADRQTFLLNTRIDLTQQDEQVRKYAELVRQDEQVITIRSSVTKSAEAQLENGVITMHEYIQKVNAEHLAKQTQILHEIQLLQARYNQKFITGN